MRATQQYLVLLIIFPLAQLIMALNVSSAIRLVELDSVLYQFNQTKMPVPHAFDLFKHAYKLVAILVVISGDH